MSNKQQVIALESRLKGCRNVLTLGVRPNFSDYSPEEAALIRAAAKIYYPTTFYADLFNSAGKSTFPSYHTYKCVQDKIKQTALFEMLQISHPKTRVFYGNHQKSKILDYFKFPFIAKIARGSAMGRGVFLIQNRQELLAYNRATTVAYIQEYLPIDRDIRVVVIGDRIVHSYWRIARPGEFRSNVAAGATVSLERVPSEALDLALTCAGKCGWDDVGIDICCYKDRCYVLEANMKYGKEGFRKAGIDYIKLMEELIENGEI
ncbi:MAG: RimK family alpha-L-glutamate ligase [Calditrichales bacterium]|nr:MAG: RimK family alpha-L-glutamate ligase [Calditrichales bacterium]